MVAGGPSSDREALRWSGRDPRQRPGGRRSGCSSGRVLVGGRRPLLGGPLPAFGAEAGSPAGLRWLGSPDRVRRASVRPSEALRRYRRSSGGARYADPGVDPKRHCCWGHANIIGDARRLVWGWCLTAPVAFTDSLHGRRTDCSMAASRIGGRVESGPPLARPKLPDVAHHWGSPLRGSPSESKAGSARDKGTLSGPLDTLVLLYSGTTS
jgi:hypothetical protein